MQSRPAVERSIPSSPVVATALLVMVTIIATLSSTLVLAPPAPLTRDMLTLGVPSLSNSASPSPAISNTATASTTASVTASMSSSPTISLSSSLTPSTTPTISTTHTISTTPTISTTQSATPTISTSSSLTPSVTLSTTPTISPTSSVTPSLTPTISTTASVSPSLTPTISTTSSATLTLTPTISTTSSVSPSLTPTISITPSPTATYHGLSYAGGRNGTSSDTTAIQHLLAEPLFPVVRTMFAPREGHVCATMWSTFFVVTGGFNRAGPAIASSRQYETYDLAAGTSSVYLPMLNLRAWHAAEAIAGTAVFVFGGFNISTNVPILLNEKITFSGTLASFGSLRVPRGRLASALVNGTKIYAIGGQNTSHVALGTVEFSNNGGGWTIVSFSLQTPRHSAKAAAVGNRVYVVGGFDINNVMLPSVECSDMASPWTNVAPLPAARASHAASAFLGLLYIMGGQNSTLDIVSDVFIYNPTNDTWSVGPSLAQASMDACSVVMP